MIRVSVIGATGYTGGELLRLLLNHPQAVVTHVTSESYEGQPIAVIHPFLKGRMGLYCERLNVSRVSKDSDVVFLGLPHGAAARTAGAFYKAGIHVIDLSADFRLKSRAVYEQRYKTRHGAPHLLAQAVYGLPELHRAALRSLRRPAIVANPGCYATATILALRPLLKNKMIDPQQIVVDAKSGVSGAGRKLETGYLYSEANENLRAYALEGHRHAPEIEQELGASCTFVPHLVPMTRGILVTAYADLKRSRKAEAIRDLFLNAYATEPFVTLLPIGASPETRSVMHTNFCQIGVTVDPRHTRVIVLAALDNLVKGASGQAIQNMNLLFDLPETTGLM